MKQGVWLPQGFSFLDGLPEIKRKRRTIVSIRAYVDESGSKGSDQYFVMAGLVSDASAWAEFSEKWSECLDTPPRICIFKMREAANFSGDFRGFSNAERDRKLESLAAIINQYVRACNFTSLDIEAHADILAKHSSKPVNHPYFLPFHLMVTGICHDLWDCGLRERFEIIFDEHRILGNRALQWYPVILEIMRDKYPEQSSIMPISPVFKTDDDFLPLQAADLFAWYARRVEAGDREFLWLREALSSVRSMRYQYNLRREQMQDIHLKAMALLNGISLSDLEAKYKEVFDN